MRSFRQVFHGILLSVLKSNRFFQLFFSFRDVFHVTIRLLVEEPNQHETEVEQLSESVLETSPLGFSELYEQYATDVLRVCYFYIGDRQKAEDVCQDVFVKLLTTKPDLKSGSEKAWLLKVALNRCRDLWRGAWFKRVILGSPVFELIPAPDQFGKIDDEEQIMSAVNQLPPDFKEIVLLHYYQGYGISEISEMLSLPEGTVSPRLSRSRKRLESLLKGDDDQ